MKKMKLRVVPLCMSEKELMDVQLRAVAARFSMYGITWNGYRDMIDLSSCAEMPCVDHNISVGVCPLEFSGVVKFKDCQHDGLVVGVRVYNGDKAYQSDYLTSPVEVMRGDTLRAGLTFSEN